ncbi:MAG: SUMF1/EgtB/PvdO family nonheme iron enzyme [Planctomycetota bacterium]
MPDPTPDPLSTASDEKLRRLRSRPPISADRYQLEGEIGRGGMGAVLRVRDLDLQRNLAMKVVLGQDAPPSGGTPSVDPQVLQRFLDEAQITGQLDHPGVVPVHELGIDGTGRVYFTMRLVKGDTADEVFWKAYAGEGGWTETRAIEVILKVCDTMAFAHQKGVLHRDLKPSNVMVGKFGEVYVMDWGLAKVVGGQERRDLRIRPETISKVRTDRSKEEADSDSPLLTMDSAVVGTPSYMAPEQAEGRIELLDQRADVYAIGAMLYQLLTGRQPYVSSGARVSPYVILAAVQAGPPPSVPSLRKGVPAELVAICEKAMARDMAARYADTRELSEDLRAYLEKRVVRAYRTGAVAEVIAWSRRNRVVAGLLAVVVFLGVGLAVPVVLWKTAESALAATEDKARVAMQTSAVAQEQVLQAKREVEHLREQAKLAERATAVSKAAQATLEQKSAALATAIAQVEQLKNVVDVARMMQEADGLFVPRAQRAQKIEAWLAHASELSGKRAGFEHQIHELRRGAVSGGEPDANVAPAVEEARTRCRDLEQHLEWLLRVERVRADPALFRDPDVPPELKRMEGEREIAWQARLYTLADMSASWIEDEGLLGERPLLGESSAKVALPDAFLAACREMVGGLERLNAANRRITEPFCRRCLAWAWAAQGLDSAARAELERAVALVRAWTDAEKADNAGIISAIERAHQVMPTKLELAPLAVERARSRLAKGRAQLAELERQRVLFNEADKLTSFLYGELTRLVANLAALEVRRGQVERELVWERQIELLTLRAHPKWTTWDRARKDVAAILEYRGHAIEFGPGTMRDLAPIGRNPKTGLYEFYDLRSAWDGRSPAEQIAIPRPDAEGNYQVTGMTGIVFVLVPGGMVGTNAAAQEMAPFLVARHELTQGQWCRLWRRDVDLRTPSSLAAGRFEVGSQGDKREFVTNANPVEFVAWVAARAALLDNGMHLPSGQQWEFACRAGTTTPRAFADADLRSACNLAEEELPVLQVGDLPRPAWKDGHQSHVPVGSLRPNGWGLHDIYGNVAEWCEDSSGVGQRVCCGGSFESSVETCTSSARFPTDAGARLRTVGVRPVRNPRD